MFVTSGRHCLTLPCFLSPFTTVRQMKAKKKKKHKNNLIKMTKTNGYVSYFLCLSQGIYFTEECGADVMFEGRVVVH